MERGGGSSDDVTCDGRLFHRRAAATGNARSLTVDRRVRRTSRVVDEAERSSNDTNSTPGRGTVSQEHDLNDQHQKKLSQIKSIKH